MGGSFTHSFPTSQKERKGEREEKGGERENALVLLVVRDIALHVFAENHRDKTEYLTDTKKIQT